MRLLLVLSIVHNSFQTELFSIVSESDYAVQTVCENDGGETCELINFKLENLIEIMTKQEKEFTIPKSMEKDEMVFKLKSKKKTARNYFFMVFATQDGSEAEFTVNLKSMSITGVMRVVAGKTGTFDTYTITYCGQNCHKLQKFTKESKHNEGEDAIDLHELLGGSDYTSGDDIDTVKAGFAKPNNKTLAMTTITFYLTPEFLEQYKDPYGVISLLINQANKGYKANKLPIQLKLHCIKKAPFSEKDPKWIDGESWKNSAGRKKTQLFAFANLDKAENKWNDLRVSADMAYLLLAGSGTKVAGESILLPFGQFEGATLGFVYTSQAVAAFSLDHEIAHLYGCWHDGRENKYLEYGHGYLIPRGYRTIMAYRAAGHEQRVQYYSSPEVQAKSIKDESVKLGEPGQHDNRRIMMERRFQIAETGDESMQCPGDLMPHLIRESNIEAGGASEEAEGGGKGTGGVEEDGKGIEGVGEGGDGTGGVREGGKGIEGVGEGGDGRGGVGEGGDGRGGVGEGGKTIEGVGESGKGKGGVEASGKGGGGAEAGVGTGVGVEVGKAVKGRGGGVGEGRGGGESGPIIRRGGGGGARKEKGEVEGGGVGEGVGGDKRIGGFRVVQPRGGGERVPDMRVRNRIVLNSIVPYRRVSGKGVIEKGVPEEGVTEKGVSDRGTPDSGVPDIADRGVHEMGVPEEEVHVKAVPEKGVPVRKDLDSIPDSTTDGIVSDITVTESIPDNITEKGVPGRFDHEEGVSGKEDPEKGVKEEDIPVKGVPNIGATEKGVKENITEKGVQENEVPYSEGPGKEVQAKGVTESEVFNKVVQAIEDSDSTVPNSKVPDSTVPDSTVPDSTVPDSIVPEKGVSVSVFPEKEVQDISIQEKEVQDSGVQEKGVSESKVPPKGVLKGEVPEKGIPKKGAEDKGVPTVLEKGNPDGEVLDSKVLDRLLPVLGLPDFLVLNRGGKVDRKGKKLEGIGTFFRRRRRRF